MMVMRKQGSQSSFSTGRRSLFILTMECIVVFKIHPQHTALSRLIFQGATIDKPNSGVKKVWTSHIRHLHKEGQHDQVDQGHELQSPSQRSGKLRCTEIIHTQVDFLQDSPDPVIDGISQLAYFPKELLILHNSQGETLKQDYRRAVR